MYPCRQFEIIEFDPETFRILLDYLHTGSCPLTCSNIPGLICAAEHYDLPELLQACFHHAKQFLRIEVVCVMLCALESYYWRYTSASELVNMIMVFVEPIAYQLFQNPDFITLSESMVQMIMSRELAVVEIKKFEAMLAWAKNKIEKQSSKLDPKVEFKCTMERLSKDLKLHKITPQELIRVGIGSPFSFTSDYREKIVLLQITSNFFNSIAFPQNLGNVPAPLFSCLFRTFFISPPFF